MFVYEIRVPGNTKRVGDIYDSITAATFAIKETLDTIVVVTPNGALRGATIEVLTPSEDEVRFNTMRLMTTSGEEWAIFEVVPIQLVTLSMAESSHELLFVDPTSSVSSSGILSWFKGWL